MKYNLKSRLSWIKNETKELFRNESPYFNKNSSNNALLFAVPFITGLMLAVIICFFIEISLITDSMETNYRLAEFFSRRTPSFANSITADPYQDFSVLNPLGALMPDSGKEKSDSSSYSLEDLDLAGTLPGIGAWVRFDSTTHFILRGEEIEGYRLENVDYFKATLVKGAQKYFLYMKISMGNLTPPQRSSNQSNAKRDIPVKKSPTKAAYPGIEPAGEGKEGVVPRELVDKLLMNPYDEIAKMRMVPAEGGGMQLVNIDPDSVLGLVGVKKDDVIKAVNGVQITNLSDATNAVNSMMSGTRFDVTLERSNKPLELKYQVK
ncbi:MAG: PDZ domain-containing protein [Synergistaceae bacterium]|nr:PDZ domain-containing protein [Synergistaceae bacterium]